MGHPHTDVRALNGILGRPEAQTDVLVPSPATLSDLLALALTLGVEEDVRLLLESALALDSQFGRHDCGGACNRLSGSAGGGGCCCNERCCREVQSEVFP